ncbi:NUDIX hydrolase [Halolamina salifodinae]|uniref:ADP-ribose pyrophosphatase n=1 Tax=Halolamina salifodinae TaxID=1202767 RepID=A0A8T4H1I2_9EURY|nr:NUDIX hydrolase [Halolamina salifodinae]MBP1988203.1 ADP-ribose pyrophosphatase [Halolamina salifodinae]
MSDYPPQDGRRHEPLPEPHPDWHVIESVPEYETGWFVAGYDRVEQPDGTEKRYYWAELPTAVVITAVTDDHVLFVEQYRPTIRHEQLELPAGVVEAGESATAAAERELEEETGFCADSLSVLEEVWVATGVLRHKRAYVFAEGLTPTQQDLDDSEFLTPRAVPADEALPTARSRPLNEATLQGLTLADEEGLL